MLLKRLRTRREELGLTPESLLARADAANIPPSHQISLERYLILESGEDESTEKEAADLARYAGCTASYLLGLTESPDADVTMNDLTPDERRFIEYRREHGDYPRWIKWMLKNPRLRRRRKP